MKLEEYVASIPDFPKEGVMFRDISPIFEDPEAFQYTVEQISNFAKSKGAEMIIGPEARGFIIGCPVAYSLGAGFAPARKPGKLPRETVSVSYGLEYGTDTLEMHKDAIKPGQKVVIVDDLLATGGTVAATRQLVEKLGGEVVGAAFIIDLVDLKGREKIKDIDIFTILEYEGD